MTALSIVEHLDPFEDVLASFIPRKVAAIMHEVDLSTPICGIGLLTIDGGVGQNFKIDLF